MLKIKYSNCQWISPNYVFEHLSQGRPFVHDIVTEGIDREVPN